MNEKSKKKVEEALKKEDEKKTRVYELSEQKKRNREKTNLVRNCYEKEIETILRKLVNEIDEQYLKKGVKGHIVMPGIHSGLNSFNQWISLLNMKRINISFQSLMSSDELEFKKLFLEITSEKKEIIGYGMIKDPNGIGYNIVVTYDNENCEIYLLENINHTTPSFEKNSKPFNFEELDLRIERINVKSSDIIINVISDKEEIISKLEELVTNNL